MLFIHILLGLGIIGNMCYGLIKNDLGLANALLLTVILISL